MIVVIIIILIVSVTVQVAFYCVIYPSLVLQYMGQAAFLSKNLSAVPVTFYASIPGHLM